MQSDIVPRTRVSVRDMLLFCGVVGPLIYVAADIIAAVRWSSYSYADQMVSELMAIDAPTRPFLVGAFTLHNLMIAALGAGVLMTVGAKRSLRAAGVFLVLYGIVGEIALLFCPMHMRGVPTSLTDQMHIIMTMVISLVTLIAMGFAAAAEGKGFRLYTLVTVILMMAFGILTGMQGPKVGANLPTPWFGLTERVDIYASMLWLTVAAIAVRRAKAPGPAEASAAIQA